MQSQARFNKTEIPQTGILPCFARPSGEIEHSSVLLYALEEVVRKWKPTELLAYVLSKDSIIESMVGSCYSHGNGFDKFILDAESQFGIKLRVHVWQEGIKESDETTIHNHPWDFASHILVGQLTTKRYREALTQKRFYFKAVYPTLAGVKAPRIVQSHRRYGLVCVDTTNLSSGAFYALDRSQLHSVSVPRQLTATLVLQGAHVADHTVVYSKTKAGLKDPFKPRYFTADTIKAKLVKLMRALRTAGR